VELNPLSLEQVDNALRDGGMEPSAVQPTIKPILAVPLHLSMFLSLVPADRVGVRSRDELFDKFWTEGERRINQRLGRKAAWTQVIDKLTGWLSDNQQISAPRYVLDELAADAEAMASDHILIVSEGRYRFFHESFFDYAFARRFAARGGRLLDLLLASEQHLFRRGQVRQVLSYLRTHDRSRYLGELGEILGSTEVRFHIKSLVFQWLSSLLDPHRQEWVLLQKLRGSIPDLWPFVRSVAVGHPDWFDVLHNMGFFNEALSNGEATREEEALWMLRSVLKSRSDRVAALLRKYRGVFRK
jgi:hypothetical protein